MRPMLTVLQGCLMYAMRGNTWYEDRDKINHPHLLGEEDQHTFSTHGSGNWCASLLQVPWSACLMVENPDSGRLHLTLKKFSWVEMVPGTFITILTATEYQQIWRVFLSDKIKGMVVHNSTWKMALAIKCVRHCQKSSKVGNNVIFAQSKQH